MRILKTAADCELAYFHVSRMSFCTREIIIYADAAAVDLYVLVGTVLHTTPRADDDDRVAPFRRLSINVCAVDWSRLVDERRGGWLAQGTVVYNRALYTAKERGREDRRARELSTVMAQALAKWMIIIARIYWDKVSSELTSGVGNDRCDGEAGNLNFTGLLVQRE